MTRCELVGAPIFIDGRVPCHACGQTVKALLVDGLWIYAEHDIAPAPRCTTADCDGTPTTWVVLYDCDDDPCHGHDYCRECADLLTKGREAFGFLGHRPTFAAPAPAGTQEETSQ